MDLAVTTQMYVLAWVLVRHLCAQDYLGIQRRKILSV